MIEVEAVAARIEAALLESPQRALLQESVRQTLRESTPLSRASRGTVDWYIRAALKMRRGRMRIARVRGPGRGAAVRNRLELLP